MGAGAATFETQRARVSETKTASGSANEEEQTGVSAQSTFYGRNVWEGQGQREEGRE
jgi:hypothetical protein